ncbi:reverse transcriptase domain-containing protein [Tanacetum coccineum]
MFKQLHINISLANALILIPKYQKILKSLLSNKEKLIELANTPLNENCSTVIPKKLPEKLSDPGKFLIPCGFSELKCKALADLGASINLMPLSVWKKLGLPELISTQMTLELANWDIYTPVGIARDVFVLVGKFTFLADFIIVDYESDIRVPLILGRPFLRTAHALIGVHGEEMILHDEVNVDIFDPEGDIIKNLLNLDKTKDLPPYHDNPSSGNPTPISSPIIISLEESDLIWEELEAYLASDSFQPGNDDLVDAIPEEFTDKLTLIESFPPGNDVMTPEDIIREIEYLLNQSPLAEYSPNNDLDDYDDEFLDHETVNDNLYDDPFDFKEEKIKDSKILIDEFDLLRSSEFLPFLKCDSVFYEDFSEVDVLPSADNEDKVFNPGILIHKNLFQVTNCSTMEKNVKIAISNASLILEDSNPPLYELPFHKEVPGLGALLLFSSKNEEKVFNLGIITSKRVHNSLLLELSHRGTKAFKVIKILESPMEIFPFSYGEDIRILDVLCLRFYPP